MQQLLLPSTSVCAVHSASGARVLQAASLKRYQGDQLHQTDRLTGGSARRTHCFSCNASRGFGAAKPPPAAPRSKKAKGPDADIAKWEVDRKLCPCGSGAHYEACCEPYHDGKPEPTAEAVMRARFSAYVKGEINYIVATTHPDNPAAGGSKRNGEVVSTLRQDAQATHSKVRWLRLKVLGRDSGPGSHEDEAFVAFQAWFKFKDQQQQRQRGTRTETLRERSRFLRDNATGRWLYVDGETDWKAHDYAAENQY